MKDVSIEDAKIDEYGVIDIGTNILDFEAVEQLTPDICCSCVSC